MKAILLALILISAASCFALADGRCSPNCGPAQVQSFPGLQVPAQGITCIDKDNPKTGYILTLLPSPSGNPKQTVFKFSRPLPNYSGIPQFDLPLAAWDYGDIDSGPIWYVISKSSQHWSNGQGSNESLRCTIPVDQHWQFDELQCSYIIDDLFADETFNHTFICTSHPKETRRQPRWN